MPTDFRSEFRPIVSQQSAFAFFICLTLAQRKHFQMRGIRPLAFWLCLEFLFGWFLFGLLGLLVFFSPSSCCVSFPFNDDLHTPHGVRTRGKKRKKTAYSTVPHHTGGNGDTATGPCQHLPHVGNVGGIPS